MKPKIWWMAKTQKSQALTSLFDLCSLSLQPVLCSSTHWYNVFEPIVDQSIIVAYNYIRKEKKTYIMHNVYYPDYAPREGHCFGGVSRMG